jgi:hypothetical protein
MVGRHERDRKRPDRATVEDGGSDHEHGEWPLSPQSADRQKGDTTMATKKAAAKAAPAPVAVAAAPVQAAAPVVAKAPKAPKPPKVPAATCSATKKDGSPCTSKVKAGLTTCVDHQPVLNRLTAEQTDLWNEWVSGQDAGSIADLLGWHKVRDLIGEPVNTNPNQNPVGVSAAA